MNAAIQTMLAAGPEVKVVVATVPRVGYLPELRGAVAGGLVPQSLADGVDAAADALNSQIRSIADASDRVAVADVAVLADGIFAKRVFRFGSVKMNRDVPSNHPAHVFVADGIHAGTVVQGLIANEFVRAMNREFGTRVDRLRPKEILRNAGLRRNGNLTFRGEPPIRDDRDFLQANLPVADRASSDLAERSRSFLSSPGDSEEATSRSSSLLISVVEPPISRGSVAGAIPAIDSSAARSGIVQVIPQRFHFG